MGIKKTYSIFNESAQKVEKIAKNKVGRELVDTLYLKRVVLFFYAHVVQSS